MDLYTIVRDKNGMIIWTNQQVAYIIYNYVNNNYTLNQLAEEFKCNSKIIKSLLLKHHIFLRLESENYLIDNRYFFNQIDVPNKAYWLGYFRARGIFLDEENAIYIDADSEEHLKKFAEVIKSNNLIVVKIDLDDGIVVYRVFVKDKQIYKDLKKWDVETIPNIPRDYVSHFIRGYYDGVGVLHYKQKANNFRILFPGQEELLKDIQKEIKTEHISLAKRRTDRLLQVAGKKNVIRILQYLYQDSKEKISSDIKYQAYLECLKWAHFHSNKSLNKDKKN